MAIIPTSFMPSGAELVIKILSEITEHITLSHGAIAMVRIAEPNIHSIRLSLHIHNTPDTRFGPRNVVICDVADSVAVHYGNERRISEYLDAVGLMNNEERLVATTFHEPYKLPDLARAAYDIRNYLLAGKLPASSALPEQQEIFKSIAPEKGQVEIDVVNSVGKFDII